MLRLRRRLGWGWGLGLGDPGGVVERVMLDDKYTDASESSGAIARAAGRGHGTCENVNQLSRLAVGAPAAVVAALGGSNAAAAALERSGRGNAWIWPSLVRMLPRPRLARWLSPVLRRSTSYYAKAPPVSFVSQLPSPPSIRRPLLFAALLGSSSVLLAVGLTNTDTATRLSQVSHASWRFNRSVSDADLARARRTELIAQIKGTLQELQRAVGGEIRGPIMLAENWLRKSEGQMTAIGLIALNSVVFLGWRFKGFV